MRAFTKKNVTGVLDIINEGLDTIIKSVADNTYCDYYSILCDCLYGFESIFNVLKSAVSEDRFKAYDSLIHKCQSALEDINLFISENKEFQYVINDMNIDIKTIIKQLEADVKYEILFLPYKLSMFDSFKSILNEAKKDERCECFVVPIPYVERDENGYASKSCYEGYEYPEDLNVISYTDYDLKTRKPDVIYIHNPYDDKNRITSIHPDYYSKELKKYTDMLVYVPYSIPRTISIKGAGLSNIIPYVSKFANKVVVQNTIEKNAYVEIGVNPNKLLALGNPKLDAALDLVNTKPDLPENWKDVIENKGDKKVFLFNITVNDILNSRLDFFFWNIYKVCDNENAIVIYRQHPLTAITLKSMRPNLLNIFNSLLNGLKSKANVIIDDEPTIDAAFYYSDAMISSTSSLLINYMLTEKPIYLFYPHLNYIKPLEESIGNKIDDDINIYNIDGAYCFSVLEPESYNKPLEQFINTLDCKDEMRKELTPTFFEHNNKVSANYEKEFHEKMNKDYNEHKLGVTAITLAEFVELIIKNDDFKKEERIKLFKKAAENCNGENGKNIHLAIINEISQL